MDQWTEWRILKERNTNGQEIFEMVLSTLSCQRNAHESHAEISSHPNLVAFFKKMKADEDVLREP